MPCVTGWTICEKNSFCYVQLDGSKWVRSPSEDGLSLESITHSLVIKEGAIKLVDLHQRTSKALLAKRFILRPDSIAVPAYQSHGSFEDFNNFLNAKLVQDMNTTFDQSSPVIPSRFMSHASAAAVLSEVSNTPATSGSSRPSSVGGTSPGLNEAQVLTDLKSSVSSTPIRALSASVIQAETSASRTSGIMSPSDASAAAVLSEVSNTPATSGSSRPSSVGGASPGLNEAQVLTDLKSSVSSTPIRALSASVIHAETSASRTSGIMSPSVAESDEVLSDAGIEATVSVSALTPTLTCIECICEVRSAFAVEQGTQEDKVDCRNVDYASRPSQFPKAQAIILKSKVCKDQKEKGMVMWMANLPQVAFEAVLLVLKKERDCILASGNIPNPMLGSLMGFSRSKNVKKFPEVLAAMAKKFYLLENGNFNMKSLSKAGEGPSCRVHVACKQEHGIQLLMQNLKSLHVPLSWDQVCDMFRELRGNATLMVGFDDKKPIQSEGTNATRTWARKIASTYYKQIHHQRMPLVDIQIENNLVGISPAVNLDYIACSKVQECSITTNLFLINCLEEKDTRRLVGCDGFVSGVFANTSRNRVFICFIFKDLNWFQFTETLSSRYRQTSQLSQIDIVGRDGGQTLYVYTVWKGGAKAPNLQMTINTPRSDKAVPVAVYRNTILRVSGSLGPAAGCVPAIYFEDHEQDGLHSLLCDSLGSYIVSVNSKFEEHADASPRRAVDDQFSDPSD